MKIERYIIPLPAAATYLPLLWKCNRLLFWKIIKISPVGRGKESTVEAGIKEDHCLPHTGR